MRLQSLLWVFVVLAAGILVCEAQQVLALRQVDIEETERSPSWLPNLMAQLPQPAPGSSKQHISVVVMVRSSDGARLYQRSLVLDPPEPDQDVLELGCDDSGELCPEPMD